MVIGYRRSQEAAESAVAEIVAAGGTAFAHQLDVTSQSSVDRFVEQEWGVAPEHIEEAKAMNPMNRFGDPREIAETVMFLASDGAGYINGQVVHVEGGWVAAG